MRVLGIDPGLRHTGWGVIHYVGKKTSFVAAGSISPPQSETLAFRLAFLHKSLTDVLQEFSPAVAAVEKVFVNKNPSSTLKLGMARGVVMSVPAIQGVWVEEYGANTIKKTVTGSGHADKKQMAWSLRLMLDSVPEGLSEDAVDALSVAVCHAYTVKI